MALQSFDVEDQLDLPEVPVEQSSHRSPIPSSQGRMFLASSGPWSWEALRDYVVVSIERRWGPFERNPMTEYRIFTSFLKRWGPKAEPISRYVFEIRDGLWRGSPVTIYRWTKGSDPYFASVIADRL
jgi:hypothetical protein